MSQAAVYAYHLSDGSQKRDEATFGTYSTNLRMLLIGQALSACGNLLIKDRLC